MVQDSWIPLYKPYIGQGLGERIADVLASGEIAGGPAVAQFEELLGRFLGNPLVTSSGDVSSSLALCLFLAGVRPGDDVVMSPLVCLATSCPVRNLFANIRWCDVDPETGNADPADVVRKITPRTRAVVVYHWTGNPADLAAIQGVARAHGLAVIEDAGEALGAELGGRRLGATGSDFAVFSFYPNRHLTTIEGAAIACTKQDDFEKVRWLKRYGIHQPSFRTADGEINPASDIAVAGWNTYMNEVAATVGVAHMETLPDIVHRHQENGLYYDDALAATPGVEVLKRPAGSRSAYWVYTFLARDRDRVATRLREEGICASKVHVRNDKYSGLGTGQGPLPGVDYFSEHCLSIPCGWWVSAGDRTRIAAIVRREAQ